jgi:hypothetical protein
VSNLISKQDIAIDRTVAITDVEAETTVATGVVSATATNTFNRIAGTLSTAWSNPQTMSLNLTTLNVTGATVTTTSGLPVGNGSVSLNADTATPASYTGNSLVNINGLGALSFYAEASDALGASGEWSNFSGNAQTGTIEISSDSLSLNGSILPSGSYVISASAFTFSGTGASSAPNFSGAVSIVANDATAEIGAGIIALNSAGTDLNPSNGFSLNGFSGSASVTSGANNDTVTLSGTAANLLYVAADSALVSTTQNSPAIFDVEIFSSQDSSYQLTARAPPGWEVSLTEQGQVTVTPKPGLQSGTYPIAISTYSNTSEIAASATLEVVLNSTTAGVSLSIVPDPIYTVSYNGAEVPSAFIARLQNLGPATDSFHFELTQLPAGFEILSGGNSDYEIPAGAVVEFGLYLRPDTNLPAPGTVVDFAALITSNSDGAISDSENATFIVPEIHAVTLAFDPLRIAAPPGATTSVDLQIQNVGNVVEDSVSLEALHNATLNVDNLVSPIASLNPGEVVTETISITADPLAALNTSTGISLQASFGPGGSLHAQSGLLVEIGILASASADDAALSLLLLGDVELSNNFRFLSGALTNLGLNPANTVYQSQAVSAINAVIASLKDPAFFAIVSDLQSIRAMFLSGDESQILAALDLLARPS